MVVVVDFLSAIVLVQQAILSRATIQKEKPHIQTFGQYAVTVTWPGTSRDDVDTYVRNPEGDIVWYASQETGGMHLEHDDVATNGSGYRGEENFERVVVRQVETGEYTVNVHLYARRDTGSVPVTVDLWRLRGSDERLLEQKVTLTREGDEQTAFRFKLDARGDYTGSNRLQASLVGSAVGAP